MKKILVYDPFAGISGDMHIGAMVDLGVPESYITESLKSLNLQGWSLEFRREQRKGITGTRAVVDIGHHDHEHENHEHHHEHNDHEHHEHNDHEHHEHHSHHEHRNIRDIKHIIDESSLNNSVKKLSMRIFNIVAEAEAKVHDKPVDEVHFHEVGAVDSIVDIVAAALAIDYIKPDRIISTAPELGSGFVKCAHGTIPVPAPATVEILKGIPVKTGAVNSEATTPTGAAILSAVADEFTETPRLKVNKIGYGVGTRDTEIPNLLRIYLGELVAEKEKDSSVNSHNLKPVMIECNIDDMNPELYEWVTESLFRAGAKDVYLTSVMMKKGRPGILLSVMAPPEQKDDIYRILFTETTTVGAKEYPITQTMLERRIEKAATPFGNVRLKKSFYKNRLVACKAEYEDVRKLAEEHDIPIKKIYETIVTE